MDHEELRALALRSHKALRTLVAVKAKFDLDIDEVMTLLVLGVKNFEKSSNSLFRILPMTIASISGFIDIPRETVRRKLVHLEDRGLIYKTSYGYMVKDIALWKELVECLSNPEGALPESVQDAAMDLAHA
jgi:predicted transcriptional regulator